MTRPVADIVIHFGGSADDDPAGGTKVREALRRVLELCEDQEVGNEAYHLLSQRLRQLYDEIEKTPGVADDIVDDYAAALEEFWRILDSYEDKTAVERLLNLTNVAKSITDVHNVVKKLFDKIGLGTADLMEWEKLNEAEMTKTRGALEDIVRNATKLKQDLPDVNAQSNALVLINAEIKKIEDPKLQSELPETTQSAIRRAQTAIEHLRGNQSTPETPAWLIPEADVKYKQRSSLKGSFASVHFGKLRGHTDVVVKVLRSDASNVDVQEALIKEADILYTIRHDHIVTMFGANHACSYPFIVMEQATNGNMSEYLKRSPENMNKRWTLLYEAAKGLEYLHNLKPKPIVHADLKLNNILISGDGKALIADFGLSVVKNSSRSRSQSMSRLKNGEVVYGGLRWRAPEHNDYQPRKESDVYAYAMCILEAFLGEPPYGRDTDEEAKAKILRGELPPRPEGLQDEAWQLIDKMTTLNAKERVTMTEVLPTLEKFAEEEFQAIVNAASTLKCRECDKSQPSGDNFCSRCGGRLVDQSQPVGDLLRDVTDSTSSATSRTQALQRLYRQLQSTPTPCPSDAGHKLLTLAEYTHDWVGALYAFGCLRTMHSTPSCGVVVTLDQIAFAKSVVGELTKDVVQSFVGEGALQKNGKPGQREAAEVIELLVHFDPVNKTELRDRIPRLVQVLQESKDDHQLCTAVLSALVALASNDNPAELRDQAIALRLLEVLKDDSEAYAKVNAAILLAGCVHTLVNAADVCVIINALRESRSALMDPTTNRDGDFKLQEYLVRLLFSIAKLNGGPELIGSHCGPMLLVKLMQSGKSESLRCAALGVVSQLVMYPPNGAVFVAFGGIKAFVQYVDDGILSDESLVNVRQLFAHSEDLRIRVATNEAVNASCLRWLEKGSSMQQINAAKLMGELNKTLLRQINEDARRHPDQAVSQLDDEPMLDPKRARVRE